MILKVLKISKDSVKISLIEKHSKDPCMIQVGETISAVVSLLIMPKLQP